MVDTVRGLLRVRKWPKKRGTPKSARQRFWIDWFRQANLLAKYVDAASQRRAIEMTKGSGAYPRDVLLAAMRGRLFTWVDETGWRWYSMAAIGDISESLDVLAQTVGSVLVRAVDRWREPPPGVVGQVLTHQGPDAPPIWSAGAAGSLSFSQLDFAIAANGNFASQGWALDIPVLCVLHGAVIRLQGLAGLTGFVGAYELDAGLWTIKTVLGVTATVAGPTAFTPYLYIPFPAPVTLANGTRVAVMWTRTDAPAATNSKVVQSRDRTAAIPASGEERAVDLASNLPAVGNTLLNHLGGPMTVNVIYAI